MIDIDWRVTRFRIAELPPGGHRLRFELAGAQQAAARILLSAAPTPEARPLFKSRRVVELPPGGADRGPGLG